jgi:predicted RNase H-like HicB family nuclease
MKMATRYFPAVIERGATSYGITFPDFPGCVSVGDSIEHALERGHEALAAHIELMLEDGDPIPEPSPIDAPLPDWLEGVGEVALRTLVRVELPGRAVRLSITMDEALAGAVDRAAAEQGFTRSGFLAEAARRMLRERVEPSEPGR